MRTAGEENRIALRVARGGDEVVVKKGVMVGDEGEDVRGRTRE